MKSFNILAKLIHQLPWVNGRQESGYKKLKLAESGKLMFDCYLLYYPTGSSIKPHTDPVLGKKHYRINIVLKNCTEGGIFKCAQTIVNWPRFKLFRPDINLHEVTEITKGDRLLLSIGWVR